MSVFPKQAAYWLGYIACVVSLCGQGLIWPTPNPAFQEGKPLETFIQPTSSGKIESGLFGCVRNNGHKFHEGIDLYPLHRDQYGEAKDVIYSVLPGRVVHVSKVAGHSSYGRYVVVLHDAEAPSFHTLYSHLASVAEELFRARAWRRVRYWGGWGARRLIRFPSPGRICTSRSVFA